MRAVKSLTAAAQNVPIAVKKVFNFERLWDVGLYQSGKRQKKDDDHYVDRLRRVIDTFIRICHRQNGLL